LDKCGFDVKLGSILVPELREYYRVNRFAFLEEKLSFLTPATLEPTEYAENTKRQ
jgi:hypothetical protein